MMSSTRRSDDDEMPSQEAYASSGAHEVGLLGNLVARRCKVTMRREHRALCYFIQQLSLRDGGLKRVAAEIIEAFPERLHTATMKRLGIKPERALSEREREALRGDLQHLQYGDYFDPFRDGLPPEDRCPAHADELFALCLKEANAEMEDALHALCLDPRTDLETVPFSYQPPRRRESYRVSAWWIDDLVATLELFRQRHIATAREAIAETEVTRMVHDAIDRAAFCRGLAVIEGDQRTGKSTAAKNYCETHPGECVFIDLEAGRDETSFFRSLARSIGTASSGQYTSVKLRGKIEDMLQAGHLTVVVDEAHYLIPIAARPKGPPNRLEWVRRSLLDKGVPVVFVSTPQFDRQCAHYEKHLKWNAKQIKGRIAWQRLLPSTLPEAEVMAVARKIAPQADAASIVRLTAYALDAAEYLFGIKRIMDNANYLAFKAGRSVATREDIKHTLDDVAPARTATVAPRKATAMQKPCKRVETPLQTAREDFSEVVPPALARRAGLALSDANESEHGGIEQPRFVEAVASV